MLDASVAANSELWMTPPAKRVEAVSGAVSMRETKPLSVLLDHQALEVAAVVMGPTRRQALQAVVVAGFGRHQASSATQQIARTSVSRRRKAAASGSATPMRCKQRFGRIRAAHLFRTVQREAAGIGQSRERHPRGQGFHGSSTRRTGRSAGSGPSEATANAPPPPVNRTAATKAVIRRGCF
jgi:hypothetical protein